MDQGPPNEYNEEGERIKKLMELALGGGPGQNYSDSDDSDDDADADASTQSKRSVKKFLASIQDSDDEDETPSSGDVKNKPREFFWDEDADDQQTAMLGGPWNLGASQRDHPRKSSESFGSINLLDVTKARVVDRKKKDENKSVFGDPLSSFFNPNPSRWSATSDDYDYYDANPASHEDSEELINQKERASKMGRKMCIVVVFFCLAIGATACLGLLYQADSKRMSTIKKALIKGGYANLKVLKNQTSPQYKALKWIAKDGIPTDSEYVPQKYALAVLYYSTNFGENGWKSDAFWMSEKGYCVWEGIQCIGENDFVQKNGDGTVFELNLTANALSGTVPSELTALSGLFELDLEENNLHGTIPSEFGKFKTLRTLALGTNNLVGTLPPEVGAIPDLHVLSLSRNRLRGTIPNTLGVSIAMRELLLDENMLSGPIPETFRGFSKIEELNLGKNYLNGSLPEDIYGLTRLQSLGLHFNMFTGTLSPLLGQLSHLERLSLVDNQFSGSIPDVFQNFVLLNTLQIQKNMFSGTIPASFGQLGSLGHLSAQLNPSLGGSMPATVCALTETGSLDHLSVDCQTSNSTTAEGVLCSCCSECY